MAFLAVAVIAGGGCNGDQGSADAGRVDLQSPDRVRVERAFDLVRHDSLAPDTARTSYGITTATYPHVDGSTSTLPLARLIASEIFGLAYRWEPYRGSEGESEIVPYVTGPSDVPYVDWVMSHIVHNKTHQAFLNVVDGKADLILVANPASPEESAYATSKNVTLEWAPIALDAIVILVNKTNPISTLTNDQVRKIFMGQIKDWSEVGGVSGPIKPYVRPENSGSQQLMNTIVMAGLTMPSWPADRTPSFMGGLINAIANDPQAIGYSVYYYVTYQTPNKDPKVIAVNGTTPTADTIRSRSYPYVADVGEVTRKDLDPAGLAHWMHDWLLTAAGQEVVGRSGYVTLPKSP